MKTQLFLITIQLMLAPAISAQDFSTKLLGNFEKGWEKNWIERKFAGPAAEFEMVEEDADSVLQVTTDRSGSGLWYPLNLKPTDRSKISWQWKIDRALSDKTHEKEKIGDDYAARVYVVFEPHLVNWQTRAICYVWAAKEPVGSIYRSPYTNSVAMVVVQSGKENKDKWIDEARNFSKDYQKIFGKSPELLSAVAIMVDTDNSNQRATTWFDDIVLEIPQPDTTRRKSIMKIKP